MNGELSVTFYDIESGLSQLALRRDELREQVTDPMHTDAERISLLEEINGIELAIAAYAQAEPRKVDSITDLIRQEEALAEAPAKRLKQLAELVDAHKRRAAWLRGLLLSGMQVAGKTEISGINSRVRIQKNPAAVEIVQPHLVPAEFQKFTVTMSGDLLARLRAILADDTECEGITKALYAAKPADAAKSLIKPVLQRGEGVPGCVLSQGARLVIE